MTIFKTIDGTEWVVNDQFSNQDFTDYDFTDFDSSQFNDTAIVGSCFYQKKRDGSAPLYDIFPNVANVRFLNCNLDNVLIKSGMDISDDGWNRNCNKVVV